MAELVRAAVEQRQTTDDDARQHPLHAAAAQLHSLAQVVNWGLSLDPPRMVADVVTQDEYTLDVCLPIDDDLVLVFDTT